MQQLLVYVVAGLLTFGVAVAQPLGLSVGPQPPHLSRSARAVALGDASAALIDDESGHRENPATLGFLKKGEIGYSFHRLTEGVSLQHIATAAPVGSEAGIALSLSLLHHGNLNFYTDEFERNRGFEFSSSVGYGGIIVDRFGGGVAFEIYNSTTDTTAVWAVAVNAGVAYVPSRLFRFGFAVRGLGSEYKVENAIVQASVQDSRLPRILSLGTAFEYPFGSRGATLMVTFANDKILGEKGILYRIGIEYFTGSFLTLRTGGVVRQNEFEPRAGIGMTAGSFSIDYGYRYSKRDTRPSHLLTLAMRWQ